VAEGPLDGSSTTHQVIVVARKAEIRNGLTDLLQRDDRFHVKKSCELLADADPSSTDLLVLAPIELGTFDDVRNVLSTGMAIVVTQPEPAGHLIAAWVYGARAVLRIDMEEVELADKISAAAQEPHESISTSVAQEIVDGALADTANPPDKETLVLLGQLAGGQSFLSTKVDELRIVLKESDDMRRLLVAADGADPMPSEKVFTPDSERPLITELTSSEREVIDLFANAYTYEEIADELSMSQVRVRGHLRDALQRLNIPTTEASQIWASIWLSSLTTKPERLRKRVDEFMERRIHPPRY
jgi:DNA-binding NarL/FixJ family response regulator